MANSAIVTLRNLAEDIKNKEVIGQYGAKAISGTVVYIIKTILLLTLISATNKHPANLLDKDSGECTVLGAFVDLSESEEL